MCQGENRVMKYLIEAIKSGITGPTVPTSLREK
jgi:hypothetical protein